MGHRLRYFGRITPHRKAILNCPILIEPGEQRSQVCRLQNNTALLIAYRLKTELGGESDANYSCAGGYGTRITFGVSLISNPILGELINKGEHSAARS